MTSDGAQQTPQNVVFTNLPKTPTGKIQTFKLREVVEDFQGLIVHSVHAAWLSSNGIKVTREIIHQL